MAIKAIRGMKDLLPPEDIKWQKLEETARKVVRSFGFSEIRTPILEKTELFVRSIGENTNSFTEGRIRCSLRAIWLTESPSEKA